MDFSSLDNIKLSGFEGFKSVNHLWNDSTSIPKQRGVYLVINPSFRNPEFLTVGVGGWFKGRNPNVSLAELKNNWVTGTPVVYIGKAGSLTSKATLQSRLRQYLKFGQSKNVGHWGGRLIWQLKNHEDLIFCWKPTPNEEPRKIEHDLITDFENQYGKLPFANLVRQINLKMTLTSNTIQKALRVKRVVNDYFAANASMSEVFNLVKDNFLPASYASDRKE